MKLQSVNSNTLSEVIASHGGKQMRWDASAYDRSARDLIDPLFNEINKYWAQCKPETLNEIWKVYEDIHETFEITRNVDVLTKTLRKHVSKLLKLHPHEDVEHWVRYHSRLKVPSTMKEELGPRDNAGRTYLARDYWGLIVLAIRVRPLVVVWGEYLSRVTSEVGGNFKEHRALALLRSSKIVDSEPYLRLKRYAESSVTDDVVATSSILKGLGTEEMPEWLLASALVRKIALTNIGGSDEKSNLITGIYRITKSSIDTQNRKFDGAVTEKRRTKEGGSEEDNSSRVENYKVKQEIPDGDIVALSVYAENPLALAERVDPTIPADLIVKCCDKASGLTLMDITLSHITLTQWCLNEAIPADAITALNKPTLLRLMGLAQATLIHWGFEELAILVLARPKSLDYDDYTGSVANARLPRDMSAKICELYPHYQRLGSSQASVKSMNPACKAIDALRNLIIDNAWFVSTPVLNSSGFSVGSQYRPPNDLRAQLGRLLIERIATPKENAIAVKEI